VRKSVCPSFSLVSCCLGAALLLLQGCAGLPPGWAEYRSAMKCHFQGKDTECDQDYEKAIKKNDKLPGVHASYGTHLLKRGDSQTAKEQFEQEVANHPVSETSVKLVFKNIKSPDSTSTATTTTTTTTTTTSATKSTSTTTRAPGTK
jgi:hypothetical protein